MSVSQLTSGSLNVRGSYSFKYVGGSTETTISTAGTEVPVTLTNSAPNVPVAGANLSNTSVDISGNPYVAYTGGLPLELDVNGSAYIEAVGGANKVVELQVRRLPVGGSYDEIASVLGTTPCTLHASAVGVSVQPGDHFKLYATNHDDTVNLIVKNANLNIKYK